MKINNVKEEMINIPKLFTATNSYDLFKINLKIRNVDNLTYEELKVLLQDINKLRNNM